VSKVHNLYVGGAGQAAVMSEFLIRGYNVAVPEVDRGDDLFVVADASGVFSRIQVKAANARPSAGGAGYSAQVLVPIRQLQSAFTPDLSYVFALRLANKWADFVVVPRSELYDEHVLNRVGSLTKAGFVLFKLRVRGSQVQCGGASWDRYLNHFAAWPLIQH
jgi:hypothetical protein